MRGLEVVLGDPDRDALEVLLRREAAAYGMLHLRRRAAFFAGVPNLILCIDESLNCAAATLPDSQPVLRYKRTIDAEAVLSTVETMLDATSIE